MIATSVKFKGFSCFHSDWAGFDEFKPINVIIGRNNSGKSQLLDIVSALTGKQLFGEGYSVRCDGVLDESFLKGPFPYGTSGGVLGGNHWGNHGANLIGAPISWIRDGNSGECTVLLPDDYHHSDSRVHAARLEGIGKALVHVNSPISRQVFRRLLADRDIEPEKATNDLTLSFNGFGATNIIRRYITSSALPEDLIQVRLLDSLDNIFGSDGDFRKLEIRNHDESDQQDDEDNWEVFLGEPKKGLIPLSRSGSGLKTVMLVLLNLLVIPEIEKSPSKKFVFAFEELENNLHPALLRRLLKFITEFVAEKECSVFLTTHSNVALDFFGTLPESQIIHVLHDGETASAKTITAHFERVGLMNELGARPSDLLQANGIIWTEGPSDRIYINRLIELYSEGELREGRDYQCAYYGGSVLAKSEFLSPEDSNKEFTNLLRLNNNIAVICDGDRTADSGTGSIIKARVQRIKQEVDQIPGAFIWITEAKEIENYIPGSVWNAVYELDEVPGPGKYDTFPGSKLKETDFVQLHLNRQSFDKCEFATKAVSHMSRAVLADRFELEAKMVSLVGQIRSWNE